MFGVKVLGSTLTRWLTISLLAAVGFYYVFQVSAGHFWTWHEYSRYYDDLANGFLAGQLHLLFEPHEALLTVPNPFDPAYAHLWRWDTSLFEGRLYLYWGPVPALLAVAVKWLSGVTTVGDQHLTVALLGGRAIAGACLLTVLAEQSNLRPPRWATLLAIAVFCVGAPTPFLLARGAVYEASIAGGQCFLTVGWLCAALALTRAARSKQWLLAASSSWGLALGCRVSLLFALSASVLATFLCIAWRDGWHFRRSLARGMQIGTPFAVAILSIGLYNGLRFRDPFEFGVSYQLTTMVFSNYDGYVVSNVWSYLARPLAESCAFPWLDAPFMPEDAFPDWLQPPPGYTVYDPLAGLLVVTPWVWLIVCTMVWPLLVRGKWATGWPRAQRLEYWSIAVFASTLLLGLAPALGMWLATMRYLGDIAGAAVLLATLGGWAVLRYCGTKGRLPRFFAATIYVGLSLCTLGLAVLTGFTGYGQQFPTNNPELFATLSRALSFCAQ